MTNKIPIQNIYYMLCYAWDTLKERDIVNVSEIDSIKIIDLFAKVMINGLIHLIKRGLDKSYIEMQEETQSLRGKIIFGKTIKYLSIRKAKVYCEFDELSYNVLHNQIIKTTIHKLLLYKDLDKSLKEKLMDIYHYFNHIDEIKLNEKVFEKVQLHRNNYFYGFLLNICKIVYKNLLIDKKTGNIKFKDFLQDEKTMSQLFEKFVRNFYKREQNEFRVGRENIEWDAIAENDISRRYLPIMQTDISLTSDKRKIIIDTKFYKNALNSNKGSEKLISENLYQIFAYLKNIEKKGGVNKRAEGILIYPKVGQDIDLIYEVQGHLIKIKTLNLNQDWKQIHKRLLNIIK